MKKFILAAGMLLIYVFPSMCQQKNWEKYIEYPGIYTIISEYKSPYDSTNYTQILVHNRYDNFMHLKINLKNHSIEKDTIVSLFPKKIGLIHLSNNGKLNDPLVLIVTELFCEGTNLSFLLPKGLPENEDYIYSDKLQSKTIVKLAPEYDLYKIKSFENKRNK